MGFKVNSNQRALVPYVVSTNPSIIINLPLIDVDSGEEGNASN